MQHVMIVQLQNERDLPGKPAGAGFEEAQGSRIGIASGVDCQLKMVRRIVAGRVGREAPGGPMFKALIHRQDDQFPGPRQFSAPEQPRDISFGSGIVAGVATQNFLYMVSHVAPLGIRETLLVKRVKNVSHTNFLRFHVQRFTINVCFE
jgi:hypothetical protein